MLRSWIFSSVGAISLYLPQRLIGEGLIGFSSKLCEVVKKYPNQIMTPLLAN